MTLGQATHEQELVSLGATDIRIRPLGIGTWAWGDKLVWGYGRQYTDEDLREAFDTCVAAGITFFDTAEIYGWGRSERLLGRFMRERGVGLVIATKFFPYPWRLWQGALRRALCGSLRRLNTHQVTLYQIHWPFRPRSIDTWVQALAEVAEQGLTRAVGVSNYNRVQMARAYEILAQRGIPLASNQVQYNLLHREPERSGLLSLCLERQVTLIAYSPLAMGILTGKYDVDNPPPGVRGRRYNRHQLARIQPLLALLKEIAAGRGKTPAQVALNWVICKGAVPIVGAKNRRQAEENIGALGWRLSPEEVEALDQMSERVLAGS